MAANVIAGIAGVFIIAVALRDVFQMVIVPRAPNIAFRVSRYLFRGLWKIWPGIGQRLFASDEDKREDFLATFAPFALMLTLLAWIGCLMLGFGLVFYALRGDMAPAPSSIGDAIYYAGSSLFSVRYDAVTHGGALVRTASITAALSGIGLVAIVIAFLFAVFGSFQQRETFVVSIGARAGAPPSGTGLLALHGYTGITRDLAQVFQQGQIWTAEVMESHLAYPVLPYFRSSHDYESWIGTLGTLLDAAVLVITVLDARRDEMIGVAGQARIMYNSGRHLTHDFSHYFRLSAEPSTGIDRSEFDHACERLAEAGYALLDRDEAWMRFSELRSTYAAHLNAMARWLEIPPIQWVGDRSLIAVPHLRAQMPAKT